MFRYEHQVKIEAAKFDIEQEEFMNVDGEAEFDVDIMKELRWGVCIQWIQWRFVSHF